MQHLACVNIPAFPLQLLLQRHPDWRGYPVAVVAEDKPQARILWVNERAFQKGALPGLRYAAAASLAIDLHAGTVGPGEIEKAVDALAASLTRFTPEVEPSTEEPGIHWLSGAGLNLFYPSPERWADSILAHIEGRGLSAGIVVGFTRFGTYALSKTVGGIVVLQNLAEESAAAKKVSLRHLRLEPELRDALSKLGIETVGEFLSLPAAGLRERFGPQAYRLHRLASGDLWAPLAPYPFREPARERLILDHPESDAARLLFLCKRLLHPLLDRLRAKAEAAVEIRLGLFMEDKSRREERIRPAAPTLDAPQLLDLLRLRLENMALASGVVEIALEAVGIAASPEQLRMFATCARDLDAGNRALARLRAEFGEDSVVRARLADGHLPEARFQWEPIRHVKLPRCDLNVLNRPAAAVLIRRIFAKPVSLSSGSGSECDSSLRARATSTNHARFLGPKYGAVDKLSGPYVMSGGWWNREIQRDYYYAETRRGDVLWIYYDRVRRKWFLQGWVE